VKGVRQRLEPSVPDAGLSPAAGWALVLVAAGAAAYGNSFSGVFVLDDLAAIVHNPTLQHLWPIGRWWHGPLGSTASGRPLLNFSLAINYACGGLNPAGYHVLNLAIHLLAGLTLFGIVRRTLANLPAAIGFPAADATIVGFSAALLWLVHPLQTQAVTYVVQRAESLMGLFYLLTLYCFIRLAEGGARSAPSSGAAITKNRSGRGNWMWGGGAVAACLCGVLTKEVTATAPLLVLLYDRTFVAGSFREAWRRRWAVYLGLAATWAVLAAAIASTGGNRSGTSGFNVGVAPTAYWLTQFPALVRYLCLSVWPHPLVFEYGTFWLPRPRAAGPAAAIVLALALATGTALALRRPAARAWGFLGAWFFGILSVTSVVPGIYQMIVEHRMYLPLAAVTTTAALGLWRIFGRYSAVAGGTLALALAAATFARNQDYRSAIGLWQDTVNQRPLNDTAQTSLAIALYEARRVPEAIDHYEAAVRLKPEATDTLNDLGCALLSVGRRDEGIRRLQEAVRLDPSTPQYHFNLGTGLAGSNRLDEGIAQFREAIRLDPGYAEAHLKLALALWLAGQKDEAIAERAAGLQLQGSPDP
jgi:Flp pilus assembly protein TadD